MVRAKLCVIHYSGGTMSTQDDILTVEEAAEYLNVSKYTIWRMIKRGDIPAKKAGRQWRISRFAILESLEGRKRINATHRSAKT